MNTQIKQITENKIKADRKCDDLQKKVQDLELMDLEKDQKLQDVEFNFKSKA